MGLIGANGLAKQHKLPVGVAMWIPNAVFALVGFVLLTRLERPGDRDWIGMATDWIRSPLDPPARKLPHGAVAHARAGRGWRMFLVPQVADTYVLKSFLFYFALLLVELRADDARLHVLRAAERHREEQYRHVARVHLSVLSDAAADLRLGAHQRAGGGADHFRHSHQAQRNHGLQSQRHQPVPAGRAGSGGGAVAERRLVCFRSLLRAGRKSQAGRHSQRDQGQAGADLSASRTGTGFSRRARTTIRAFTITSISIRRKK